MSRTLLSRCASQNTIFQILIAICIITFFNACSASASNEKDNNSLEKFPVIQPTVMDTVFVKDYVAEIQSIQNVELRARVKGFIEKIHIDEGKPLQAGQVLFTMSSREFKEELLKANAQLKSAIAELKAIEVEIKNTKLLVDESVVSKSELEVAQAKKEAIQAKIEEAKSAIAVANLNLSFTQVRAPFSGVINRIPNKIGSLVEEGTLLTTLSNNKEVFAYFNVAEKEYLDFIRQNELGKQNQVSLLLADNQPFNYKGTIETTENEIDKSTGNLAFRARFANPQQLLKHGASAKVLMTHDLKNVLVVPQKSTFEVQDKINVYVIDAQNVVHIKSFVPRLRMPHLYVVESGLSADDKIIYEGIQMVKEGDKISPQYIQANQVIAQLAKQ
jgi:RND family efflux transporter MFP subunit